MGNPFFVYSNKDGESGTGYLYIKTPKGIQSLKNINRAEQRHRHRRGTLSGKEKIIPALLGLDMLQLSGDGVNFSIFAKASTCLAEAKRYFASLTLLFEM